MQLIGKGAFSKVYKLSETKVLIKSRDYVKECFAFSPVSSSLFPRIVRLDYGEYTMKLYPRCTAPKQQLNSKAYSRYKTLRGIAEVGGDYYTLYDSFTALKGDPILKEALLEALGELLNYGDDIRFEISPRNISFTNKGNLVLLDVFYFHKQKV